MIINIEFKYIKYSFHFYNSIPNTVSSSLLYFSLKKKSSKSEHKKYFYNLIYFLIRIFKLIIEELFLFFHQQVYLFL